MKARRFGKIAIAFVLSAVVAMSLALTGCFEMSPTDTVKAELNAIKSLDYATMAKFYDFSSSVNENGLLGALISGDDGSSLSSEEKETRDKLLNELRDFDYTVSNEKIDGDTATVDVTITTYDWKTFATNVATDYVKQAFSDALSSAFSGESSNNEMSQEQMVATFLDIAKDYLGNLGDKNTTGTATVHLTKVDGAWHIDTVSNDVLDAITGGAASVLQNLSDSASSLSGN